MTYLSMQFILPHSVTKKQQRESPFTRIFQGFDNELVYSASTFSQPIFLLITSKSM